MGIELPKKVTRPEWVAAPAVQPQSIRQLPIGFVGQVRVDLEARAHGQEDGEVLALAAHDQLERSLVDDKQAVGRTGSGLDITHTSWTWGNGTAYARSFDTDGRLASYPLGPLTRTLSFDAASRITGYHHPGEPAWDQSFGYDALGRLSSFTHGMGSQTYRYDANGTELVLNGVPYTYALAAASNQPERGSGGCDLCHARPRRSRQRRRGSIDPETVTEVRR